MTMVLRLALESRRNRCGAEVGRFAPGMEYATARSALKPALHRIGLHLESKCELSPLQNDCSIHEGEHGVLHHLRLVVSDDGRGYNRVASIVEGNCQR
jgi:hypothetical protein